jgi:FkbM family methyltransferase
VQSMYGGKLEELAAVQTALSVKLDGLATGGAADREAVAGLAATQSAQGERLDQFATIQTALSVKLDELLVRFVVPIGPGMIAARNQFGYLALNVDDPVNIAYLAEGVLPEPGTISLVQKLLDLGGRFLDIGANVGLYTLIAARRVGPCGRVLAIEPTPETAKLLELTTTINGIDKNVTIQVCAAGQKPAKRELFIAKTSGHNSLYPLHKSNRTITVDVVPVDDLVRTGSRWDLAKIDVEGAELDVLLGMGRVLEENPEMPIIVEFDPSHLARAGWAAVDWFAQIERLGFKVFVIDEAASRLRPLDPDGKTAAANVLLFRSTKGPIGNLLREMSL